MTREWTVAQLIAELQQRAQPNAIVLIQNDGRNIPKFSVQWNVEGNALWIVTAASIGG
jgi:hypothetical protein